MAFSKRACKSNALLQLCLRVCQSPECEHHRAPGVRKRCGLCRNHPEPADHVKRAGGWRADIGGCSRGQWGGGCISDHHASLCADRLDDLEPHSRRCNAACPPQGGREKIQGWERSLQIHWRYHSVTTHIVFPPQANLTPPSLSEEPPS